MEVPLVGSDRLSGHGRFLHRYAVSQGRPDVTCYTTRGLVGKESKLSDISTKKQVDGGAV